MADKLTERVALTISQEMLDCLRKRIRKSGRTLLGEIRYLIEQGLAVEQGRDLDTRVKALEADNQVIKEAMATYRARPTKTRARDAALLSLRRRTERPATSHAGPLTPPD